MTVDSNKAYDGEIFSPTDPSMGTADTMRLPLEMPPGVRDMGLGQALLGQLPYWGLKRTMDAYRKAVESGVEAIRVVTEFHVGRRNLETEIERWNNIDTYRDAARQEAETQLQRALEAKNLATAARLESEIAVQKAADRKEQLELIRAIERNNLEAEKIRSDRKLEEERQGFAGKTETLTQKALREAAQKKKDYDEIMATKAEYVKEYGGEENLPMWAVTMFENLLDQLAR